MRGKVVHKHVLPAAVRITPAYAGKSSILYDAIDTMRDHPRLCGEKMNMYHARKNHKGSPPPMRGKGYMMQTTSQTTRITPAYAGKR